MRGWGSGSERLRNVRRWVCSAEAQATARSPADSRLSRRRDRQTYGPVAIDLPRRVVSQGHRQHSSQACGRARSGLAYKLTYRLAGGLGSRARIRIFNVYRSPWPRYAIACLLLAQRGDLPQRPAVMLGGTYDAGLMRLSEIAVRFRHREFKTG